MFARFHANLRSAITIGGILFAMVTAIGIAALENQRGERLNIPILEGGVNDEGVQAEPIPTPLAAS